MAVLYSQYKIDGLNFKIWVFHIMLQLKKLKLI